MAESNNTHLHPNRTVSENPGVNGGASHGIEIHEPPNHERRPSPSKAQSAPSLQSPMRHHKRAPSRSKDVKETLNARSHYGSWDDDGPSVHRINQYVIKQEVGRGSFGSVHLAVDQFGNEYAVKEFSKSRLRKRAQSNLLRKPNATRRPDKLSANGGFNSPMHRSGSDTGMENNSLSLIKEEIAIMKKLSHTNLVSLIEVLDDPQEDSLYMVLEMCKKGVAMKVGLEDRADPYDDETCRCWFRDMILGIEYLHAQGIIHRDIKPDNCLITNDDVLKIVDFGVSEMFEKASEMATAKSAGSPAFMPPELCVARHGPVSGKAADIWSMGVTLYCLRYGRIPFEKGSMLELYDSIRNDDFELEGERNAQFEDLIRRILEKDPEKRIDMDELRVHPWVTKDGTDNLLSKEENCSDLIEPPTEAEMDHAITGNMAYLMAVVKAVKRFKRAVREKRGRLKEGIFGKDSKIVAPPQDMDDSRGDQDSDRRAAEEALAAEGLPTRLAATEDWNRLSRDVEQLNISDAPSQDAGGMPTGISEIFNAASITEAIRHPLHGRGSRSTDETDGSSFQDLAASHRKSKTFPLEDQHPKGQARDPLEEHVYVNIGADPEAGTDDANMYMVSESPSAVDLNIFEQAYQDEMNRILEDKGESASMYMNRRVEHRDDIRRRDQIKDASKWAYKRAGEKYDEYSKRGYTKWESASRMYQEEGGRFAARHAGNKVYNYLIGEGTSATDAVEASKEAAKIMAQEDAHAASEGASAQQTRSSRLARLGGKTGGAVGEGISGLAKRAQDALWKARAAEPSLGAGGRLARGTMRVPKAEREASTVVEGKELAGSVHKGAGSEQAAPAVQQQRTPAETPM